MTKDLFASETELTQTAYADDENTGSGFTFIAKSDWTATTKTGNATKGSGVSWLKLMNNGVETYSGGAGTFTFVITLEKNTTGQIRTASIEIVCGKDEITISVTQSGARNSEGNIVIKLPLQPDIIELKFYDSPCYDIPLDYKIENGYFVFTLPETIGSSYFRDLEGDEWGEVSATNPSVMYTLIYCFAGYNIENEIVGIYRLLDQSPDSDECVCQGFYFCVNQDCTIRWRGGESVSSLKKGFNLLYHHFESGMSITKPTGIEMNWYFTVAGK